MWMCADKQCVLSSPASELQRAVSLLGTEQDSSQLQQTLWVMGARLGSAWPVHYSESLSTSAGGEKVKLSCQALWWIHYDAFFSAAFFFFSFCLAFISLLSQNQRIFVFGHQATETAAWQPAREGDRQTDEGVQRTSYWPRSGTGLNWRKFFPKTKFQSSSEPEKNVPQGSNKGICIVLQVSWLFSERFLSVCLFSGKGRYRKSVCWTTSPPLWTASRGSSGRRPTPRESLWPESERAPGCRWVTRRTGNTTGPVKQTAGGRYKASAGPSENLKMP